MNNYLDNNERKFNDELQKLIKTNPSFLTTIENFRENYSQKIKNYLESVKEPYQVLRADSEFQKLSSQLANTTAFDSLSEYVRKSLASFEANSIFLSSAVNIQKSEFVKSLEKARKSYDFSAVGKIVTEATTLSKLNISDFSYLRLNINDELIRNASGIKSFPKQLMAFDTQTALRLLNNKDYVYDTRNEVFTSNDTCEDNSDLALTSDDLNIATSTESLLVDIQSGENNDYILTLKELIDFISELRIYGFAVNFKNQTGIKIYEIIKNNKINFAVLKKEELYYHARVRNINQHPYIAEDMEQCPCEKSSCGRFNRPGLSCYYMSDSINGAENEVLLHIDEVKKDEIIVQVAKVCVDLDIKLLDLTVKKNEYNVFYKYLQSPIENINDKWPKVYLLPNYVADCCRACGYDGIKYYGIKDYYNYVLWKGGKVNFKEMVKGY